MSYFSQTAKTSVPLIALHADALKGWLAKQPAKTRKWLGAWVATHQFTARADTFLLVPNEEGGVESVLVGVEKQPHIWSMAHLPAALPAGTYRIDADWSTAQLANAALGFALAQYQFTRYRKAEQKKLLLVLPKAVKLAGIQHRLEAITLVRDLINTPPQDMRPKELAAAAQALAKRAGAKFTQVMGDDLLKQNYPAIHAVGRAGPDAPRLLRLQWGNPKHPRVALVGKGVTFDTGGLDLKPLSAMRLMKKDMGGAALVLGLAQLVIAEKLPIYLDVLIPAVENAIDGNAFRPSDILASRKGLTIEIGSTDAEGRLVLADALTAAQEDKPALVIDVATLTGAARTALGTELPALYANDPKIGAAIVMHAMETRDPMWHMPLWQGYAKYVNSTVADITNSPNYAFAGSITAALFLERFIEAGTPWVHIDSYAWNAEAQPGRPVGGEALCLRGIFDYLDARFR
jgi:leucyl aminopeptidase